MITTIQNNAVTFNINQYINDRGWEITSPSVITHSSENSGDLEVLSYNIRPDVSYEYSFTITSISGGSVIVSIGGTSGDPITTSGYIQAVLTSVNTDNVKIWSDADVVISNFNISEISNIEQVDGKTDTITWSEDRKGWVTFKDIIPEVGFSMYTNLFTIKNGALWIHKYEGTTPNNFYGVQYSSKVKFPVSSVGVKTYHSIAVHANKVVATSENGITTQLGNVSDLINFDFSSQEGIHYANLLRDKVLNDKLKGRYIVIELSDEESNATRMQIFKIVLKSQISTPNE